MQAVTGQPIKNFIYLFIFLFSFFLSFFLYLFIYLFIYSFDSLKSLLETNRKPKSLRTLGTRIGAGQSDRGTGDENDDMLWMAICNYD